MSNSTKQFLAFGLCSAALAGCATTHPVNYQRLTSASQLAPNPQDKHGHVPFLYSAADNDWHKYNAVIIDPVIVYGGPDQQFGKTPDADKAVLAAYMEQQFAEALKPKFALAKAPGPTTLRIQLTLTGLETNTPVLSSLTKIAPVNLIVNVVQTARDKQAIFTGSVSYAVEIYDSASNQLLRALSPSNIPSLKTSLPASERAPPPEQASAMAPRTSWPNSTDRRYTDETATCRSSRPIQGTRRVDRQSHAALHAAA
jgi:Protein of unknown function (DUF3313)